MSRISLQLLLPILSMAGCVRESPQISVEAQVGSKVFQLVRLYYSGDTNAITNTAQVFAEMDLSRGHRIHPAILQEEFRRFGKYAGFESSLYEKYAFLPRGFTNALVPGEIIFLNAQPFPNLKGELGRHVYYVANTNMTEWGYQWCSEAEIQQIFKEAGTAIPTPPPSPPPPRVTIPTEPLFKRIERYFDQVEVPMLGRRLGKYLMYGALILIAVPLMVLCWHGLRRAQK